VIAFAFVRWAQAFLPFGYGFAAGAMVYLVATEFIPEALETGRELPNGGRGALVIGFVAGVIAMLPLLSV
jgi:ZIP family zinc transporter